VQHPGDALANFSEPRQNAVMSAADRLDPYGRAEKLDVHGTKDVGFEILTNGHNSNIIFADAGLPQCCLIAAVSNHCLCKGVRKLSDVLLVGIDAQNMVSEPCQLERDRAEDAEANDCKTSHPACPFGRHHLA
jgi:hypothetical protein